MASFLQDIRYALRMFAKNPGYVLLAVIALGLGIGANCNIFGFFNVYLLRPLPSVKDADRVVVVDGLRRGNRTGTSYPDFIDFKQQNHVFEGLAAVQWTFPILTGRGEPERVLGVFASDGFFDVYTVRPALGRAFLPAENAPGGERVAIISNAFWQSHFGSRPDAIGQALTLDGVSHKVIGVMPATFRFSWDEPVFWAPLTKDIYGGPRGRRNLNVAARLKPGVTLATARAEMETITRRLEAAYADTNGGVRANVESLTKMIGDGPRDSMNVLMAIVAFVLLIACANVANLQLARATGRANEVAIRTAMGAGRGRIIRQALTESIMVSLMGGVLGFGLSYAGAKLLLSSIPSRIHPINANYVDGTALAFTAAIAILTGVISGLAPAFQISRVNVNETLKEGGRSGAGSGARAGLRNVLVVAEISLAVMLLLAAGLLVKSFVRLQQVSPGFRTDNLLTAHVWLPESRYPKPELRALFFRDLVERVGALPGIEAAAATTALPMANRGAIGNFVIEGRPAPVAGHEPVAGMRSITPGYFQALGIPLRKGRHLTEQDKEGALQVAIINDHMARQHFAGEDPIGKRIKWGRDPQSSAQWLTIVGVAGNTRLSSQDERPLPEMFAPVGQAPPLGMTLAIRTRSADPALVVAAVRGELRRMDPDQPITAIRSMGSIIEESITISKHVTIMTAIFAGIAALMAAMGIYGVISYSVAQRTHELGIRMALGAGSTSVLRLVLRQAMWVVGIGLAIGVPGAAAITGLLKAFLFGVDARDPLTFVVVPVLLAAVALVASALPARRATRVDPVIALRYQ
jgi:putative ABC transport system permease protein